MSSDTFNSLPKINGLASKEQKNIKITLFVKNVFFYNNLWLNKDTTFILSASCSSCQDASNGLWFDLKRSCWKFDLRSRSWPDRKSHVAYQSYRRPYRRPEHDYGFCIALAFLYQKLLTCRNNCWWLFMTWNDLGDMRKGYCLLVAIFRFRASCLPSLGVL